MRVEQQNHRLIIHDGRSECWIDPWGKDSLRVRMSAEPGMDGHDWALTEPVEATDVVIRSEVIDTTDPWYKGDEWAKYHQTGTEWTLTNGKITAKISTEGWITFLNQRGILAQPRPHQPLLRPAACSGARIEAHPRRHGFLPHRALRGV